MSDPLALVAGREPVPSQQVGAHLDHASQPQVGHLEPHGPCLDQYLCMAFAQLTCRESLRDI